MLARVPLALAILAGWALPVAAQVNDVAADPARFQYLDVFELEVAADPQIAPDGSRVVYVRQGFDIMTDGGRSALWVVGADGSNLGYGAPTIEGRGAVDEQIEVEAGGWGHGVWVG